MRKIKCVETYVVSDEQKAIDLIDTAKNSNEYTVLSSSYKYKKKTSKGVIVDEAYIVTITKEFGGIWE